MSMKSLLTVMLLSLMTFTNAWAVPVEQVISFQKQVLADYTFPWCSAIFQREGFHQILH